MSNVQFTPEEVKEIGRKLGFIVDDWAKSLISHIIKQARDGGIKVLYMNTSETLDSGCNEDKNQYFYERLPGFMGFKKETANLKGEDEIMWAYHFDTNNATSSTISNLIRLSQRMISLEQVPKSYQGAVLNILGRKEAYTVDELKRVLDIVSKKDNKNKKPSARFFYDWSREWSGGQRFRKDINESVVLQRISSGWQDFIHQNPPLLKFWAFLLSQPQHFANDVIGFGLISKINRDIWVINEIQTDVINKYRALINVHEEKKKIDVDTLIDMLEANNRSNWIPYVENNEAFREQLLNNPNDINQLCDNNVNIEEWRRQNAGGVLGMDLIQHFQSVNLTKRILRSS